MKKRVFKKTAAGVAALVLALSAASSVYADEILKGDTDNNGVIQTSDIIMLKGFLLNSGELTAEGKANSDINSDGSINVIDFILLKNMFISDSNSESLNILLKGTEISADDGITVDGTKVTITKSGSYLITGEMTVSSEIIVNTSAEDKESVNITLESVKMSNDTDTPCIMVENADKTKITFNGENSLENTYDAADAASAVIYAKDDITFTKNSSGSLNITSNALMGVYCSNDIKFNSGKLKIKTDAADTGTANADAVKAKGDVEIGGGTIKINAAGDGLKSSKAALVINDGTIEIKAGKDALQGETEVTLNGGDITACGDRCIAIETGTFSLTGGTLFATSTTGSFIVNEVGTIPNNFTLFTLNEEHPKTDVIVANGKEYTPLKKYNLFIIYEGKSSNINYQEVTVGGKPFEEVMIKSTGTYSGISDLSSTDQISKGGYLYLAGIPGDQIDE